AVPVERDLVLPGRDAQGLALRLEVDLVGAEVQADLVAREHDVDVALLAVLVRQLDLVPGARDEGPLGDLPLVELLPDLGGSVLAVEEPTDHDGAAHVTVLESDEDLVVDLREPVDALAVPATRGHDARP